MEKYPVIEASESGIPDEWFKSNPDVAGMAWGAGLNGSSKETPRSIIINPYTKNLKNDNAKKTLIENESIRHLMDETKWSGNFTITKEQKEWAKKLGSYKDNPEMLKQTIVARMATGDFVPNPTKEQIEATKKLKQTKIMPDKTKKEMKKSGVKSDADLKMDKKTGLGSTSEKEQEIEDLLSEEEALAKNYERIEKQGMSDQGIVSPKELKEFGKDVYKGAKAGVKKVAKGAVEAAKAGVKKVKEYMD
jgi:hypothetical protein